ncbi:MAG: hypothetical protein JXL80_17355 [Planctomycetes bacterium]|nr:hypothetical protein [Planctomycetota bacterium]
MTESPERRPPDLSEEVLSSQWHRLLDRATLRLRATRRRRRQVRLVATLVLVVTLVSAYLYFTSDNKVESLSEDYLSSLFHAKVEIHQARFSFFRGIELDTPRVCVGNDSTPIFEAETVHLTHDPLALLIGRLKVRQIEAVRPVINLVRRDEHWNFEPMFPDSRSEQPTVAVQAPVVYVDGGKLSVSQYESADLVHEHKLELSGIIQPSTMYRGLFQFFASDLTTAGIHGNITGGMIDVPNRQVSFEGRAADVQLDESLAQTLPPEAAALWRRFQPKGSVSVKVTFDGRQDIGIGSGFRVQVGLNGVSLAYEHEDRRYELTEMTGQCDISQDKLHLTSIHGTVSSQPLKPSSSQTPGSSDSATPPPSETAAAAVTLAFSLDGDISGIGDQRMGHDLTVSIDDMDLSRLGVVAPTLSRALAYFYRDFSPTGRADLRRLRVTRPAGSDARPGISGLLVLRDAGCTFRRFPYPIEQISGNVRFDRDTVTFDGLTGRQGSAQFEILEGSVTRPGADAGIHVKLLARGLPLDDRLKSALADRGPQYVEFYESLAPRGRIDLVTDIVRPEGPDQPFDIYNTLQLQGSEICYSGFPYRLTDSRGTIVIHGPMTEIRDVVGRHGSAEITVNGKVLTSGNQGPHIDLAIDGRNVALDDDLAAALPEDQQGTYRSFHPSGLAQMHVTVRRNAETEWRLEHRADIMLDGANIIFDDFPYPVAEITGRMKLSPGLFLIENLSGRNAEAAIAATGNVRVTPEAFSMDMTFSGNNVLLDRNLRGALALEAQRMWNDLQPSGRVDVVCHLTRGPETGDRFRTKLSLVARDLSMAYRHFPYPVRHAQGRMEFDGSRVTIDRLVSVDKGARLELGGTIDLPDDGSVRSDLKVRAAGLEMDNRLRKAVPKAFASAMNALAIQGQLNVNLERLIYNVDTEGRVEAQWQGSAVVDEARLNLGMSADRVVAYIELNGALKDERLSLDGRVTMPHGRLDGKEITNLRATLRQQAGSLRVVVDGLEGDFYGGRFDGGGQMVLGHNGSYELGVMVRDVDFQRFVTDGMGLDAPVEGGTLAGDLVIQSLRPDGAEILAHGLVRVTGAKLYRLPVVIQILNVLSLQPGKTRFEEAEVRFAVDRGTYLFESIYLKGGALSLHGAGRMERDGRLNLVFKTATGEGGGMLAALKQLAAGIQHELLLVEVTGTMREPVVEQKSLTTLGAPLRELLTALESIGRDDKKP